MRAFVRDFLFAMRKGYGPLVAYTYADLCRTNRRALWRSEGRTEARGE